jgi:molybdopterin-guanine dinucleotide biosynthesis protein A
MNGVTAYILSGGRSSRMGRDKALLPFGDATLTSYQFERLAKSGLFDEVKVALKSRERAAEFLREAGLGAKTPIACDSDFDGGREDFAAIYGIAAILADLPSEFGFLIAVDTPFFELSSIANMIKIAAQGGAKAVLARTPSGFHPLCAIYKKTLASVFNEALSQGDLSIKRALNAALKEGELFFADFAEEQLQNLNNPTDYDRALARLNSILL